MSDIFKPVSREEKLLDRIAEAAESLTQGGSGSGVATIESHFSDAEGWGESRNWLDADEWEALMENGIGTPFILKGVNGIGISSFGVICDLTGGGGATVIFTQMDGGAARIVYASIGKDSGDEVYTIFSNSATRVYKDIAPFAYPTSSDQDKCLSVDSNGGLIWKLPASLKPIDIASMSTVFVSLIQATSSAATQSGNTETRHADLGTGGMLKWFIDNIVTDFSNKIQSVFTLGENYFIADYASKDETSGVSIVHAKAVNATPSGSSIYVFTYDVILYSDGTDDYAIVSATPSVSSALS